MSQAYILQALYTDSFSNEVRCTCQPDNAHPYSPPPPNLLKAIQSGQINAYPVTALKQGKPQVSATNLTRGGGRLSRQAWIQHIRKSNSGWHATNLNDDKTEAITVGTRFRSSGSCGEHLKVGNYEIPFKPFVKCPGVFLDSSLTMSKQVSNLIMLHLLLKKKKIHWLLMKQRIYLKIATLAYRHFNNTLPSYLSARLTAYTPARSLRSCSAQILSAPRVHLKCGIHLSKIIILGCVFSSTEYKCKVLY